MRTILRNLWTEPAYFQKSLAVFIAGVAAFLPTLPLEEWGAVGYWLGKVALPLAVLVAARGREHSGLTADEAAKLRALIPTQAQLDAGAPKV